MFNLNCLEGGAAADFAGLHRIEQDSSLFRIGRRARYTWHTTRLAIGRQSRRLFIAPSFYF